MSLRCPRCGSDHVREDHVRVESSRGDRVEDEVVHDRACLACRLYESHSDREPDFAAWERRWSGPVLT